MIKVWRFSLKWFHRFRSYSYFKIFFSSSSGAQTHLAQRRLTRCSQFPVYLKSNEAGLVLISDFELAFGSCLAGVTNMTSKQISMMVKEAIIRLKKTAYMYKEDGKTSGVSKTTVKRRKSTAELNIIKRPVRPPK